MSTANNENYYFEHNGYCPACEKKTTFIATSPYFRGSLKCKNCQSVPRQRLLMHALTTFFPNWRRLAIHESSPGWDILSRRFAEECESYVASQYDTAVPFGTIVDAYKMPCKLYQCEDLERQTFPDEVFDVVITQDVFEHVFRPDLAIKEIARTLRPGGATLMTVPIVRKTASSLRRARLENGTVEHLLPAEYHGNPISNDGALVTIDWGYDIVSYLQHHSGLSFIMLMMDNIDLGIRAGLNEVLIGFKKGVQEL
ncbi:class I SAM-dependent methyltransferase [Methylocystis sp. S23]|jgi:SAM-dependent methyltransferase